MMKLFLILAISSLCSAWWCTGHMLVAHIARQQLISTNPAIYNTAVSILSPLNGALTHNIANTLTETACWPDDIKSYGFTEANDLHFIDRPYTPDNTPVLPIPSDNVVWAITNFNSTLSRKSAAPLEKSMSLRFLAHFLGDIHQPLHDTTMFSSQFPGSDYGGNLFKIVYDSNVNELHALWDSAIGMMEQDLPRPLSQDNWNYLDQMAAWYTANYTRSDLAMELADKNVTNWSLDAYTLAIDYAYYGIQYGGTPSQAYVTAARNVVMRQITLGGYRLADLLVSALSNQVSEELEIVEY